MNPREVKRRFPVRSATGIARPLWTVALGSLALLGAAGPGNAQPDMSGFEARLDSPRVALGIPGLSVAVVKEGRVIYAQGLGHSDDEGDRAGLALGLGRGLFGALAQGARVGDRAHRPRESEGLWWENPLDVAAVERSPLARLFLEEFLTLP